ncbi:MAG: agmatine deiminase family protein [Opitutaceae bacterium]|nr:agmatine deiminase family protein [Opitutaceae bacterium]
MPAEWSPQVATWLSWPHNTDTWPGYFDRIPAKFAEIASVISRYQEVRLNCASVLQENARYLLSKAGADLSRISLYDHSTNDAWCRDHGPIFVKNSKTGTIALTDWQYNAWGGKYPPFDLDNKVPLQIGEALQLSRFEFSMVLEGGSLDVNGEGVLLTTSDCLLNPNRNPEMSKDQIEEKLREGLGVTKILWLGEGIVGDDTDGHIDDISRFFKADGIVTAVETDEKDPNFKVLRKNLEQLKSFQTKDGRSFDLVELPMPEPCFCDGERLPASYANFLILNGAVLVPVFGQAKRDAEALDVLAGCFPDREIIPIDCLELVWGLGTLHCISQQQPL